MKRCLPFRLPSPNALDPAQTFTAFLPAVLAEARRFAHTSWLRADTALHQVLGMPCFPSDDTLWGFKPGSARAAIVEVRESTLNQLKEVRDIRSARIGKFAAD